MKYKILTVCLSLILLITACGAEDLKINSSDNKIEENKKPNYGGVINLPLTNMSTLNPLLNENELYYYFNKLIFESLFEFKEDLDLKPELAESYTIEDGGKTLRIRLKDGVLWHDGESFSAEDVIFTVDCIKALGQNSIYYNLIEQGIGAFGGFNLNSGVVFSGSGLDLVVEFDKSYSNSLEILTFPIIPKHSYKHIQEAISPKDFKLIGTGPFKFDSYGEFKELRLIANEDYRDGRPYLDQVVGKVLDTREDTLRAFETGQVNTLVTMGTEWEKYGKNSRMRLVEYASSNYEFLGFNFNNELFKSPQGKFVRKAMAYAIDRDSLIDKVYIGHATKADLPIHPDSWLKIDGKYKYDLEKAHEEMKKAGFGVRDSEGYYLDENNKRLSFNLLTNTLNPLRFATADSIRRNLKELGIEIVIVPETRALNTTTEAEINNQWELVQKQISGGDFDLVVSGWEHSVIPEISFMLHSSKFGQGNYIRYVNPSTDRFLEDAFYSGLSRESKLKAYEKLERNLLENLPYVSLVYKNKALIMDKRYLGETNPSFYDPYRGIERLYLPENADNK